MPGRERRESRIKERKAEHPNIEPTKRQPAKERAAKERRKQRGVKGEEGEKRREKNANTCPLPWHGKVFKGTFMDFPSLIFIPRLIFQLNVPSILLQY